MSDPSEPLPRNAGVEAGQMHELPASPTEEELANQYPTKPFTPVKAETAQSDLGATGLSPMELARQAGTPGSGHAPTSEELHQQATKTLKSSAALREELERRFPNLSDGQKALLAAKLSRYSGSAGKAASLLQAGSLTEEDKEKIAKELEKAGKPSGLADFLSLITTGDTSLRAVTQQMAEDPGDKLNPIQMLKAQYALQTASKSVNFATAVIGQGLNFVKTVMQTQI